MQGSGDIADNVVCRRTRLVTTRGGLCVGALLVVSGFLLGAYVQNRITAWAWGGGPARASVTSQAESKPPAASVEAAEPEPELEAREASYDLATRLRTYVYVEVPGVGSRDLLLSEHRPDVYTFDLREIDSLLADRRWGGWCWLYGKYLQELYERHDMPSVLLGYGERQGTSHVVTLVKCDDGRWYVQDATFDTAYVDPRGDPLPFDQLLAHLAAGEADQVRQSRPTHRRLRWMLTADSTRGESAYVRYDEPEQLENGLYVFPEIATYDEFVESFEDDIDAFLEMHGLGDDPAYMLLRPINLEGDPDYTYEIHQMYQAVASDNRS